MKKKILIVDDDSDILVFLRTFFEKKGFEVLTVDTGFDCIKELECGFNGIVLMDLMMPFMDGWDTIKEIVKKGLSKNVTISIITACESTNSSKMKDIEPYIYTFNSKPFDLKKLVDDFKKLN